MKTTTVFPEFNTLHKRLRPLFKTVLIHYRQNAWKCQSISGPQYFFNIVVRGVGPPPYFTGKNTMAGLSVPIPKRLRVQANHSIAPTRLGQPRDCALTQSSLLASVLHLLNRIHDTLAIVFCIRFTYFKIVEIACARVSLDVSVFLVPRMRQQTQG